MAARRVPLRKPVLKKWLAAWNQCAMRSTGFGGSQVYKHLCWPVRPCVIWSELPIPPHRDCPAWLGCEDLYGAFEVKHLFHGILHFLPSSQFLCLTWNPVSSPRPTCVGR